MSFLNTIPVAIALAAGTTVLAGPVVNLAPSQYTDGLDGIDNSEFVEIRGATVADNYIDFSILSGSEGETQDLLYQGTLMTRIVRSHMTGDLHFNYRILGANPQLDGRISNVEVGGFGTFQTRVEYRNDAISTGDEGPFSADRSISGDIIDFAFQGGLNTADESHYFFAMTNTDIYYEDSALATIYLETGESVSLVVDSAMPGVPTPGSLALLGTAGLLGARRRR